MKITKLLCFSIIAFGLFTITSCTKDSDDLQFTNLISANFDGTLVTFNHDVTGSSGTADNAPATRIKGTTADGSTILITLTGDLREGVTYDSATATVDTKAAITYNAGGDEFIANSVAAHLITVKINSINDQNVVDGSFKGELISGSGSIKTITNGRFSVKVPNK